MFPYIGKPIQLRMCHQLRISNILIFLPAEDNTPKNVVTFAPENLLLYRFIFSSNCHKQFKVSGS